MFLLVLPRCRFNTRSSTGISSLAPETATSHAQLDILGRENKRFPLYLPIQPPHEARPLDIRRHGYVPFFLLHFPWSLVSVSSPVGAWPAHLLACLIACLPAACHVHLPTSTTRTSSSICFILNFFLCPTFPHPARHHLVLHILCVACGIFSCRTSSQT